MVDDQSTKCSCCGGTGKKQFAGIRLDLMPPDYPTCPKCKGSGIMNEATPKPVEMDRIYRERACRLLFETGTSPGAATCTQFITAYQAVLTKELLWATCELLQYKQREVHQ